MSDVQPTQADNADWQKFLDQGLKKGERLVQTKDGSVKILNKDNFSKMPWGPTVLDAEDIAKRVFSDPNITADPKLLSKAKTHIDKIYNGKFAKIESNKKNSVMGKIFGGIYTYFAEKSKKALQASQTTFSDTHKKIMEALPKNDSPIIQVNDDHQIKAKLDELQQRELEPLTVNEDPSKWTDKERGEVKLRLSSLIHTHYIQQDPNLVGRVLATSWALKDGAVEAFKAGDKAGDLECTFRLAQLLESSDPNQAIILYEKASKKGNLPSTIALGRIFNDKKDIKKAIEFFTQAADKGDNIAAEELYKIYTTGEGFKSPQLAEKYFRIDPAVRESNRNIKELLEKNAPGIISKLKINEDSSKWTPREQGDAQMELYKQLKEQFDKHDYGYNVTKKLDAEKYVDSFKHMARASYMQGSLKGDEYCRLKLSQTIGL